MAGMNDPMDLPAGVHVRRLITHRDDRGSLVELFRRSWPPALDAAQWNVVRSRPGVFRGVHAHVRHDDYLVVLSGHGRIGLRDLRRSAPTFARTAVVDLPGDELASIVIPHGVAHGFFFPQASLHVYAMTTEWDTADELGCHFADPELGIPWDIAPTYVSERDRTAPPLRALQAQMDAGLERTAAPAPRPSA